MEMKYNFDKKDVFDNKRFLTSNQREDLYNLNNEEKEYLRYCIEYTVFYLYPRGKTNDFFETDREVSDIEVFVVSQKVNKMFAEEYPDKPVVVDMNEIGTLTISKKGREDISRRRYLNELAYLGTEEEYNEKLDYVYDNNTVSLEHYPSYILDEVMGIEHPLEND